MILGVKLNHRLVAVVAFDHESVVFQSSRFVALRRQGAEPSLAAYFQQVLAQTHPTAVFYYAPAQPDTLTDDLVTILTTRAAEAGVPAKPLTKLDVLGSFGVLPFHSRFALAQQIEELWPELSQVLPNRRLVVAEAASAAIVGDFQQEWPPL